MIYLRCVSIWMKKLFIHLKWNHELRAKKNLHKTHWIEILLAIISIWICKRGKFIRLFLLSNFICNCKHLKSFPLDFLFRTWKAQTQNGILFLFIFFSQLIRFLDCVTFDTFFILFYFILFSFLFFCQTSTKINS